MQEARPGNPSKDAFSGCEERLNELAARLHKGEVKGPELAKAAALVNYDLAKFYSGRATSEIGDQHKQVQGGYDLLGAADAFEQALIWNSTSGEVQANASSQGNGQQAQTNGKSAQATAQQPPAQGHNDAPPSGAAAPCCFPSGPIRSCLIPWGSPFFASRLTKQEKPTHPNTSGAQLRRLTQ